MTAILYSYDQCPYCARSIAALKYAQIDVEIRGVNLNKLPLELTGINAKASVPFLIIDSGNYIDESWDIVKWALQQNDPEHWLGKNNEYLLDAEMLIETNDSFFAPALHQYQQSTLSENSRADCEEYCEELEEMLNEHHYLISDTLSLADIGVVPFVNLMAQTEPNWFAQAPYPKLRHWLNSVITTPWLKTALTQHKLWQAKDPIIKL